MLSGNSQVGIRAGQAARKSPQQIRRFAASGGSVCPLSQRSFHMKLCNRTLSLSFAAVLAGCQASGAQYQANVFDASQVNTQQPARTITIITVSPAQIVLSNKDNQKAATMAGGLLGVIGGAVLGANHNTDTAIAGGVAGGALGALGGSMVNDKTLVEGVLIGYSENGQTFTSTQVGHACEFKPGEISLMVTTRANETRIQPNAVCPEASNS